METFLVYVAIAQEKEIFLLDKAKRLWHTFGKESNNANKGG
jgi:hypothetical protein